jgi:hypothetical protein
VFQLVERAVSCLEQGFDGRAILWINCSAIQSSNPQWGIERFLSTTDSLQPEHANIQVPFDGDWQEMKEARIMNMVWKLSEWKRAVGQLHKRCRSKVVKLFSGLGEEETRIARTELYGRSDCVTTSSVRQKTE